MAFGLGQSSTFSREVQIRLITGDVHKREQGVSTMRGFAFHSPTPGTNVFGDVQVE